MKNSQCKSSKTTLWLADGASFDGTASHGQKPITGEVVFNTGMVGYVETLTDPSYAGQILVFTYPPIGNYGVPKQRDWESSKIHVAGVVMNELCTAPSHTASVQSLQQWLEQQAVPWTTGVDTRALTKHLRSSGSMMAVMQPSALPPPVVPPLLSVKVVPQTPKVYNDQYHKTVIVLDCGAKESIVRMLAAYPLRIKRVPMDYDLRSEKYDGLVISNGPGDPTDYPEVIATLKQVFTGTRPVFGICLGSQLMGLAAGGSTYKLPFGHHGQNQPCISLDDACVITSQNHGYAIEATSLPKDWQVTYRNLNDDSVEGIAHKTKPFFSVQFHPEAAPGPTDTMHLFEKFYASL